MSATLENAVSAPAALLLAMRHVDKQFDNGTLALRNVNLSIVAGSFVSLLGASGCGKSTVLRLIAGLTPLSGGSIDWTTPRAKVRPRVSYVFQEPTLMPWASALENVALPLKISGENKRARERRALEALAAVGLADRAEARPRELSGGMKMRVSIARAVVTEPELLLLDEPFAALDEITRFKLNNDLAELWHSRGFTTIFVTHSVFESVYLSQRVIILAARPGRIFSEVAVDASAPRTEEFRTSAQYAECCRMVSEQLAGAMQL
jgi:NitT/TauT family transport system ATP-binding protein